MPERTTSSRKNLVATGRYRADDSPRRDQGHSDRVVYNASICGQVTDENSKPLRGIDVRALDPKTGDQGHDLSGPDESFCARLLTGHARYQVNVFAGGQKLEPVRSLSDIEVGDGRVDIQLAVAMPHESIAGTVTDSDGAPIADAIVRVDPLNRVGAPVLSTGGMMTTTITDVAGHLRSRASHRAATLCARPAATAASASSSRWRRAHVMSRSR